jgi:ATP synthase protein I
MAGKRGSGRGGSPESREMHRVSLGITIPTTFAASVVVGVVIGYGLDHWLGTGPWLTLVFLVLGFAAGILEIVSVLKKMG